MQGVGVERLYQGFYTEMAGLKLAGSFSARFCQGRVGFFVCFFSRGFTIAVFKSDDKTPEARKVLMMLVIVGRRTSRFSNSSFVGTGSRSHDMGVVF